MCTKTRSLVTVTLLLSVGMLWGQDVAFTDDPPPPPVGFREMTLGDPIDQVKAELEADLNFAYRGDPDVSLLPQDQQVLIETSGRRFIERAFFQFHNDRLYTITIQLNEQELDFYTMYTSFVVKYGEPDDLSPQEVVWLSDRVRFSLERPLTVKYVDLPVFQARLDEQAAGESMEQFVRDRFVDQF